VTGGGQDAVVALRDADGRPVRVGRENSDVIVQVAKTAQRGRIRLDAAARQEFLRAFAAAEPPAYARGGGHPAGGGCPDVEAGVTGRLERFFWDLPGTVVIGGREFRCLYLEEARALGYADGNPAVLLRREDDGTVFEVGIDVTARQVRPAPAGTARSGPAACAWDNVSGLLPPVPCPEPAVCTVTEELARMREEHDDRTQAVREEYSAYAHGGGMTLAGLAAVHWHAQAGTPGGEAGR
jgi:hypothetical protein